MWFKSCTRENTYISKGFENTFFKTHILAMTRNYHYEPERYNNSDDYYGDYYESRNAYLQPSRHRGFKENASIGGLMVVGTGLMLIDMSIGHMLMASLAFLTAGVALMPRQANNLFTRLDKLERRYGINLNTIIFCMVGAVFLLDISVAPASAQFMDSAEKFFTKYFDGVDPKIIQYVFAILRGLFLIYLGVGLIKVVQAARNDEDWQTLARTPIIVALTVVVGDILSTLVTG